MEYIRIGKNAIAKTAALAPMAGVADRAYRILCKEYGAAALVSEMVSAKGLCYGDPKTNELCTILPEERPMGLQLFGSEPDFMARAVTLVQKFEPDWIDINMGCPVPKVIGTGSGSALMKNINLAAKVTEAAVKASSIPVTVKFRTGWDENSINAPEFAVAMQEAGASAVAVHGRTKMQMYSGKADWDIIRQVKQAVSIPVIGNGDVTDYDSCMKMYNETGCDLVMIGRGSYGNPFVFREIDSKIRGAEYIPPTLEERMETMLYHIRLIIKHSHGKPPEIAIRDARKHAAWYMSGCYGAASFRARCYQLSSYDEAQQMAEDFIKLQRQQGMEKI
ncbi:MAG: tRNA dihydrouridine synthase DusB [Ruminococcus sp.]